MSISLRYFLSKVFFWRKNWQGGGKLLLKNGTIDCLVFSLLTMLLPDRIYIARGPWCFEDFRNIFLPNISEDQKKVLPSERGAPGTVPFGKSVPGY